MKRKHLVITTVVLTLSLAFAAMASAYGNRGFSQAYDQLTPEKQQEVRDIFDKHSDKLTDLKNQAWAKQLELDALTDSGKATKKDIQDLVGEIAELRVKYQNEREAMFDEVEKATGLEMSSFGRGMGGCPAGGRGNGAGYGGNGDCPAGGAGGGCPRY